MKVTVVWARFGVEVRSSGMLVDEGITSTSFVVVVVVVVIFRYIWIEI